MGSAANETRANHVDYADAIEPAAPDVDELDVVHADKHEVFKSTAGGVNFRTVSWQRATILFLKIQFAIGTLSIPTALHTLGAVGGSISIVGWQVLNTYTAVVQGTFRNNHPQCHTLADMVGLMCGPWGREFVGLMFLVADVLVVGGGILGISIALNAVSDHAACSVIFSLVALAAVLALSLIRTFGNLAWATWIGFISILVAVLVVVIGVTTKDRPAAAPQEGPFDLGWETIAHPTFAAGITASATIFISSSGSANYLPVISEMRRPRDFRKAVLITGTLCGCMYLTFSLVMYRWCGKWIANPSLGSAGGLLKKVSYGIALPGLVVSSALYNHVASKYLFVRILRNSHHLQENTLVHWGTWICCNLVLGVLAFVSAEAIPVFNYLLALAGSLCFAPMSLVIPACLWLYDFSSYRRGSWGQKMLYAFHVFVILLASFLIIGGTYGTALSIRQAYASGLIGGAFKCADNSGTIGG